MAPNNFGAIGPGTFGHMGLGLPSNNPAHYFGLAVFFLLPSDGVYTDVSER